MKAESSQWNNNTAFLLAATGSAVGLGNIWGFTYKAAEYGGGIFVLLYIFFVITLGFPVFMAEVFIGKKGKSNPVTSIENLATKANSSKKWSIVGYAGILASLIIAGYYAVIAGFVIDYGFIAAQGVEENTAKDMIQFPWHSRSTAIESISGDIIWTDQGQKGFIKITGLPMNDPIQNQYQVWILDPLKYEQPVDGGVFDVTQTDKPVIIPINPKLPISKAVAFAITIEQPGGVVVSSQPLLLTAPKERPEIKI